MTLDRKPLAQLEGCPRDLVTALPAAAHHFAPSSTDEAAEILAAATDERAPVLFHGAGTRQGLGHPVLPDVVVSTSRLDRIIKWEPEDLTAVVEPGASVRTIEQELGARGQTAGLPEWEDAGSVGGVVATGTSGYRRARLGPTRDRVLEVLMVTGDGRKIRGGGQVVKNVSGYDLPRLATGSMGRLGLIASICFKLWPLPEASATVEVTSAAAAWRTLYRPLAVLETPGGSWAFLQGTGAEVRSQAALLGGAVSEGLDWPEPPAGAFACSIRVRPSDLRHAVELLGSGWNYVAQHGVGVIDAATDDPDADEIILLRRWAEEHDGALVVSRAGPVEVDPWGTPPPALGLQRRIVSGFDPYGIANPGRLPGGV